MTWYTYPILSAFWGVFLKNFGVVMGKGRHRVKHPIWAKLSAFLLKMVYQRILPRGILMGGYFRGGFRGGHTWRTPPLFFFFFFFCRDGRLTLYGHPRQKMHNANAQNHAN